MASNAARHSFFGTTVTPSLFILLKVVFICFLVVTTLLAATGDTTADRVLGQIVFSLNAQNFVDGAGLNFNLGSIGDLTPANGVAVDTNSTPKHLYVAIL